MTKAGGKMEQFWFKDPKDMTDLEKWQLPIGPIVQCRRDWTFAEFCAGKTMGVSKSWSEMLETKFHSYLPSDTLFDLMDIDGNKYKLEQFANGAWFRRLINF